jgi:hypothetical protein
MLSGDMPFKGDTYAILIQQLQEALPPLHQFDLAIPPAVDGVIQKATHQQPKERYTSAGNLAHALWQAATSQALPVPFSTVIDPLQTSMLPMEHISSLQNGSLVMEEQFTPTAVSDTPVIPLAQDTHPVSGQARPHRLRFITMLVIGFIICGLALPFTMKLQPEPYPQIGAIPAPEITVTLGPPLTQLAANAVRNYYDTWNSRNYRGAYSQLEPAYQKMHPYSTLLNSYVNTLHSSVKVESSTQLADGTFKITVTDVAVENSSTGIQTVTRIYYGYFLVKQENGDWKLTPYFTYIGD